MLEDFCAPALLYLGFSLTQIIIDVFKNYFSHFKMNYLYLRHKIYYHYYNLIESKVIKKN